MGHSLEYIPRNIWGHSQEYLGIFPGMFEGIPRNVWGHSQECLGTFPGMFADIPRYVWRHSPEYNIPPIPRVHHIPFPVPVFLVSYIAHLNGSFRTSALLFCSIRTKRRTFIIFFFGNSIVRIKEKFINS